MKDLVRALIISAVVGTALCAIHCRDLFATNGALALCDWHVYTSYLVPFAVSLVSARLARPGQRE